MKKLLFRTHALKRMAQRNISRQDISEALYNGRIIMRYPDDKPFASQIVLGHSGQRPLHVLIAEDVASSTAIIITVYEPDPDLWDDRFEERKRL